MPREVQPEEFAEACALLRDAADEREQLCAALGLDKDVSTADLVHVVRRFVEDQEAHERLSGLLIELLQMSAAEQVVMAELENLQQAAQ